MAERYQWVLRAQVPDNVSGKFPEISPVVLQLLHNRGLETQKDVDMFLTPDYGDDQHDPFLFRDMHKAVDRIAAAVEKKEKIVIHGDYDADGVGASAILYKTLQKTGADVTVYLPHRDTEGYGLNMATVQSLHDDKTNLIITVDCGISNKPEVEKATELGMDVIITDHHNEPPELPDRAFAIINPKVSGETYPFEHLAGAGVAFKLCQALIKEYKLGEAFEKWLLDIVAISTVSDYVRLIGENRVLVKYGLIVLKKSLRPGLQSLFETAGIDPNALDTETIMFKVGPCINAAGRVKHANAAFDMLVEEDEGKARTYAEDLGRTNKERQQLSAQMTKEALSQAEPQKDEYVIFMESDAWPLGLTGLVAGNISQKFNRPAFVITTMGDEVVGSGRSIEHFDIIAALQSMDELFHKYGGHPRACGFSLKQEEDIEEFKKRMRALANEQLADKDLRKTLSIEAELEISDIDWKLVQELEQFAPHGEGNPKPVFAARNAEVREYSCVGKTKSHLRMTVAQNGVTRKCIGFSCGEIAQRLATGDEIGIAFTIGINEWNGNREIQLEIKDIELPS
ncbi:MAG: single-stranded-DNA-specific exonuclease RecJ [Candidatus Kerfeldbacteria bacterium]